MTPESIRGLLMTVSLRHPLASWLTSIGYYGLYESCPDPMALPRWEPGMIRISVRTQDRDTGEPLILSHLMRGQFEAMTGTEILCALRQSLHDLMRHEVDEALHVCGKRAFDPHARR
jgi:hypothetical protein